MRRIMIMMIFGDHDNISCEHVNLLRSKNNVVDHNWQEFSAKDDGSVYAEATTLHPHNIQFI